MAYDKVVDSAFLEAGLTLVGDSIRAKGGTSAKLEFPNGMKAAVEAIDTSEDLDEVLDEQDSIIDQIQAALEGKAAASVETCTVEITSDSIAHVTILSYSYLATDGKVSTLHTDYGAGVSNANISLENVVCGSLIYALAISSFLDCDISDNVRRLEEYGYNFFEAPTTANSIGTIHFYDND